MVLLNNAHQFKQSHLKLVKHLIHFGSVEAHLVVNLVFISMFIICAYGEITAATELIVNTTF